MTFSEAYAPATTGALAVENAADILGLDDRTVWGWNARYNDEGPEAPEWRLGRALDQSTPVDCILDCIYGDRPARGTKVCEVQNIGQCTGGTGPA